MSIGKQIKRMREMNGMTQEQMAEMIDISPTYISRLEHNRSLPSVILLQKIAELFHVSMDVFFRTDADSRKFADERNFEILVADCSATEAEVILDIAASAKRAIKKHQANGNMTISAT